MMEGKAQRPLQTGGCGWRLYKHRRFRKARSMTVNETSGQNATNTTAGSSSRTPSTLCCRAGATYPDLRENSKRLLQASERDGRPSSHRCRCRRCSARTPCKGGQCSRRRSLHPAPSWTAGRVAPELQRRRQRLRLLSDSLPATVQEKGAL
jgi:hypothetical protein